MNLPTLILGVILDVALIAVIVLSQGIVERWRRTSASRVSADEKDDASVRRARLRMTVANGIAAADIAVTIFFAMPDVILQLTNFVDTGDSPFTSEPEEYSLVDGVATIPFSQVEDGHLHRFAYTAADGTEMRFIIILKNGGAYGVGLDACETCGDAGYYEQDGKIICKRCDVAINLATIGFKGGCNPIPFPYQVDDGAIIIHAADLDALSAHFQ